MTSREPDDDEVASGDVAPQTPTSGPRVYRSGVYARLVDGERIPDSDRTLDDVVRHAREAGARAEAAHEGARIVLAESHAAREQARPASVPDEERMRQLRDRIQRWQRALRERNGES